jgi:membrane-bound serine protease (ClpP class)
MSTYLILAFVLIVAGLLLLLLELVFPSGILAAVALVTVAVGVALVFRQDTTVGLVTLVVLFVAVPVVGKVVLHYWPRTPFGRHLFLQAPEAEATLASAPVNQELEQLIGRVGRAVSDLRPCGVSNFDGRRVDVITEGIMVDSGQWVRCIDVRAGKVLVRPVEKSDLTTLETVDFS